MLAQKFGVALPELADGGSDDARRDSALRESLLKAHEIAAAYFKEQLAAPAGGRARAQLAERGVTPADDRPSSGSASPPTRATA